MEETDFGGNYCPTREPRERKREKKERKFYTTLIFFFLLHKIILYSVECIEEEWHGLPSEKSVGGSFIESWFCNIKIYSLLHQASLSLIGFLFCLLLCVDCALWTVVGSRKRVELELCIEECCGEREKTHFQLDFPFCVFLLFLYSHSSHNCDSETFCHLKEPCFVSLFTPKYPLYHYYPYELQWLFCYTQYHCPLYMSIALRMDMGYPTEGIKFIPAFTFGGCII